MFVMAYLLSFPITIKHDNHALDRMTIAILKLVNKQLTSFRHILCTHSLEHHIMLNDIIAINNYIVIHTRTETFRNPTSQKSTLSYTLTYPIIETYLFQSSVLLTR